MSGKGQSKALEQALQAFKKNQAKNQALSVKMAEEKAKVGLSCTERHIAEVKTLHTHQLTLRLPMPAERERVKEQECKQGIKSIDVRQRQRWPYTRHEVSPEDCHCPKALPSSPVKANQGPAPDCVECRCTATSADTPCNVQSQSASCRRQ